jgi:hypothetical protein
MTRYVCITLVVYILFSTPCSGEYFDFDLNIDLCECPKCQQAIIDEGNPMGQNYWTDGWIEVSKATSDGPGILKCPACLSLFWEREAKKLKGNSFSGENKRNDPVLTIPPTESDLLKALEQEGLAFDKAFNLRLWAWWLANDASRNNATASNPTFSIAQKHNMNILYKLLDRSRQRVGCSLIFDGQLTKAEIARERGNFNDCIQLLSNEFKMTEQQAVANQILTLAQIKDTCVRRIQIPKEDFLIRTCPRCTKSVRHRAMNTSINNNTWTDGIDKDCWSYDDFSWISKCPYCSKLIEADEWEDLVGKDPIQEPEVQELQKPSSLDLCDFLLERQLSLSESLEGTVRIQLWYTANNTIRYDPDAKELTLSQQQRENLEIISSKHRFNDIMAAEIARELGNFDECLQLLSKEFDPRYRFLVKFIRHLALIKDPCVRKVPRERIPEVNNKQRQ